MKFIVFDGSPAGVNSNTNVIAESFLNGAKKAGSDTENVFLIAKILDIARDALPVGSKHQANV